MVPSLADAVTIFSKWREDSAEVLVVSERPFQQSRRGVLEQSVDWKLGMQGKIAEVTIDGSIKGKKSATVVLEAASGNLSLNIGICAFVYEEPREAGSELAFRTSRMGVNRQTQSERCSLLRSLRESGVSRRLLLVAWKPDW